MAFDLFMPALNHGSSFQSTSVESNRASITTMVDTVWDRLESVMGVKPLTVVAVRDKLGVTYQAGVKLKKGGGLNLENNNRVAKMYGLNPEWLASGKGPKMAAPPAHTPPSAPAAASGPFNALTPDEERFLDDYRRLLDSDRERYRAEISTKATEMRQHMEKIMGGMKEKGKQ